MISLVVFDLGRVLVRICDGWEHACRVAGVPWPEGRYTPERRAAMHPALHRLEIGQGDVVEFCRAVAPELGLTSQQMEAVWRGYNLGTFPGAGELIDDLRVAGISTACLSNTNSLHWEQLSDPAGPYWDALRRLDHRLASHLIHARKPEPEAYGAVERLAGVAPERIVFFDDLQDNIEAARARGWHAHLIQRCENPIPTMRRILVEERVLSAES